VSGRLLHAGSLPDEPIFQNVNEFMQLLNNQICVRMLSQVAVMVVEQQNRCRACGVAGRHIIDAVTDLAQINYQSMMRQGRS
jgi:hypothetical protein